MKTFLAVMVSALVGSVLFWRVGSAFGNALGAIAANSALFLLLLGYAVSRPRGLKPATIVAASVGATLFLGLCAMAGGLVHESSRPVGNLLMAAVSIGYYPPGADVPLMPGFAMWGASSLAVILAGLSLGTALRGVRPSAGGVRSEGRGDAKALGANPELPL